MKKCDFHPHASLYIQSGLCTCSVVVLLSRARVFAHCMHVCKFEGVLLTRHVIRSTVSCEEIKNIVELHILFVIRASFPESYALITAMITLSS